MDSEGMTTHTEVWKWNDGDGQQVVLINDVNPKSSNQKSNSGNVFDREKRNFDEKNIPHIAEFVPNDVNLYSETQTPITNVEGVDIEENKNDTNNLKRNNDYKKDNGQLKTEYDDSSITLPPEKQDSPIPQKTPRGGNFFEFNKEHINNELTKIESKTTPFSNNNYNEGALRNNIKKKIIKRLVPKINLTHPNENIGDIENVDESSQHNFNYDESIKENMPTEHSTNDNRKTNEAENIESNRDPGLNQLLQGDKISNDVGKHKNDKTTENPVEENKSDELPSSSTKKEIKDKLQNTNEDKLDKDELVNNDLFTSDDFFGDGNILGTDESEVKDDKINENVSNLDETLDNSDDENKINNVPFKPNENSRFEQPTFESNGVTKIPQTDEAHTDNYENSQHLNNTPKNDVNTNNQTLIKPNEVNNVLPLDELSSNDKQLNLKINDKDAPQLKEETLNKPENNDIPNDLLLNTEPNPNFESPNPLSEQENSKYPQPNDYKTKTTINNYPDDKLDLQINDRDTIQLQEQTSKNPDEKDIPNGLTKLMEDNLDKSDENVKSNDLPDNIKPNPNSDLPNHVSEQDISDTQPEDYLNNEIIDSYPENIEPIENDFLPLNDAFANDKLYGDDDKSNIQINDNDPVQLKKETSYGPNENDLPNSLTFNEEPNSNNKISSNIPNEENKENPQDGSFTNNDALNNSIGDNGKSKENILPWNSWLGFGNLFSPKNNSKQHVNEPIENDFLPLKDAFANDDWFGDDDTTDLETTNNNATELLEENLDKSDENIKTNDFPHNKEPNPNSETPNHLSEQENSEHTQPEDDLNNEIIDSYPEIIKPIENDFLPSNDLIENDNWFGDDDTTDLENTNNNVTELLEENLDKSDENVETNDFPDDNEPNTNSETPNLVSEQENSDNTQPEDDLNNEIIDSYPENIEPIENDFLPLNDLIDNDNWFGDDDTTDLENTNNNATEFLEENLDKSDENVKTNDFSDNKESNPNSETPNHVSEQDNSEHTQPEDDLNNEIIDSYPEIIKPIENDFLPLNDVFANDKLFGDDDKSNLQINDKDPVQLKKETSYGPNENDIPNSLTFNEEPNSNNKISSNIPNEKNKENASIINIVALNNPLGDNGKSKENVLPWNSWFGFGNLFSAKDNPKLVVNDKHDPSSLKQPLGSPNEKGVLDGLTINEEPQRIQINKAVLNNKSGDVVLNYSNVPGLPTKESLLPSIPDTVKNDHELKFNGVLNDKHFDTHETNDNKLNNGQVATINRPSKNVAQKPELNNNGEFKEPGLSNQEVPLDTIDEIGPNILPDIIKNKPKTDQPNDVLENNGFNLNPSSDNTDNIYYQHSTKLDKPDSNININIAIQKPEPNHINYSDKEYLSTGIVENPPKKDTTKNNHNLDLDIAQDDSEFKKNPKSRKEPTGFHDSSPEDLSSLQDKKNKITNPVIYENPNHTTDLQNSPPVSNELAPVKPTNIDSIINSSILDNYDLYPKDFWKLVLQNPNIYNHHKNGYPNQNINELPTYKLKNPTEDGNKNDKNSPNVNTVDIFDAKNPERHDINNSDGTFRPFTPNRYNNERPAQSKPKKGKTNYFNINNYLSQPTPAEKNSVNSIPPVDYNNNFQEKSKDSIQTYVSKNNEANSNAHGDDSGIIPNVNNVDGQNHLYDSFFKTLTDRLLNHIDTAIDSKLSQQADPIRNNQKPDVTNDDSRKDYQIEPQTLKNMKSSHNKKAITNNKTPSNDDMESEENLTSSSETYAGIKRKTKNTKMKTKKSKTHISSDESDIDESVEEVYKKKKTKKNTGKSGKTKVAKKKTSKSKKSNKTNSPSSKKKNVNSKKSKVSTKKKTTKTKKKSNGVKSPKGKSNKIKKAKKKSSSVKKKSKNNNTGLKGRKTKTNKNKKVTYYVNEDVSSAYSNGDLYVPKRKKAITRYVIREAPKTENPKYVIKKPICIDCEKKKNENNPHSHHHKCGHAKNKHRDNPGDPLLDYGYGYYGYF